MPRIPSANPEFERLEVPDTRDVYPHPAMNKATKGIPMAFQITSPTNRNLLLLPHALVLHVNPSTFQENYVQKVERFQTRGGFVEQHWGSDLTEISADASTGAFINIYTGLTSLLRQKTIAWDRYQDLLDLYHNNGSLHDPSGNIVLQGYVMLMYDRGSYLGTFRDFSMEETDESPFAFKLSWTFKVEHTLYQIAPPLSDTVARVPSFQLQNKVAASIRTVPSSALAESPSLKAPHG